MSSKTPPKREAELPVSASSLAYTTILSVIPLIAVSFSIFKAFGGLENLYGTIEPFVFENLRRRLRREDSRDDSIVYWKYTRWLAGVGGLVGLLFTSMSMLSSIEKSINRIWKAPLTRSLFQRITLYWFFITWPLGLAVAIGAATSLGLPFQNFSPPARHFFILVAVYGMYRYVLMVHWNPH